MSLLCQIEMSYKDALASLECWDPAGVDAPIQNLAGAQLTLS